MNKKYLKRVLSLTFIICLVFSLTGCGFSKNEQVDKEAVKQNSKENVIEYYSDNIKQWTIDFIEYLDANSKEQLIEDAESNVGLDQITGTRYFINYYGFNDATVQLYNSWNSTRDELGSLKKINKDSINIKVSDETGKLCVISVSAAYEKNNKVDFEFTIDDSYSITGAAINPSYTTAQKIAKAGMNTLIGMGTVFCVLIFISFIISLFKYINKWQNHGDQKNTKTEIKKEVETNNKTNSEEELVDDLELVAVIAAAIRSYEGEENSNGLVVRSIRRIR